MRSAMRSLDGKTALVIGGGAGLGRAVALALSARGVRIVVTGRDEKALGETVGEIVHGGGKARHVAGAAGDPSVLAAAVARARDVFGQLDVVIDAEATDVDHTFSATASQLHAPGRLLAVTAARPGDAIAVVLRERARGLLEKGITCNAVVLERLRVDDRGDVADDVAMDVSELVGFLCSRAASRITGQCIAVDGGPAPPSS